MNEKKKIYLEKIAKLLDEYETDNEGNLVNPVECAIVFINDKNERWDYTGVEFENLDIKE